MDVTSTSWNPKRALPPPPHSLLGCHSTHSTLPLQFIIECMIGSHDFQPSIFGGIEDSMPHSSGRESGGWSSNLRCEVYALPGLLSLWISCWLSTCIILKKFICFDEGESVASYVSRLSFRLDRCVKREILEYLQRVREKLLLRWEIWRVLVTWFVVFRRNEMKVQREACQNSIKLGRTKVPVSLIKSEEYALVRLQGVIW